MRTIFLRLTRLDDGNTEDGIQRDTRRRTRLDELAVNGDESAVRTLDALKAQGFGVAIDDFGTGYSSLSYLKRLPLDVLKIDQSFVRDLEKDQDDRAMCEAMIVMAHKLGLKVVAEGIETPLQREILLNAGCDFGQGYLFAKPLLAVEFARYLGSQSDV